MPPAGLVRLSPGTLVSGRWTIVKKLGGGEFGTVYLCKDNNGRRVALKAEPIVENASSSIKKEAKVLRKLGRLKDGRKEHFCHFLARGRDVQRDEETGEQVSFRCLVMSAVGTGLFNLLRKAAGGMFSHGTAVGVSIQLLHALEALHSIGYLHLDIKPENAAIGRRHDNERRLLYLIDFGLSRRYFKKNGRLRKERARASFRGTFLYASMRIHMRCDSSRRDDMESWFYAMVDMYTGSLPWSHERSERRIRKVKCKRLRTQPEEVRQQALFDLLQGCPPQFAEILQHIDNLDFHDKPNYEWIEMTLHTYLNTYGIDEFPYDWENGRNRNNTNN